MGSAELFCEGIRLHQGLQVMPLGTLLDLTEHTQNCDQCIIY